MSSQSDMVYSMCSAWTIRKERNLRMIKVLFICHGIINWAWKTRPQALVFARFEGIKVHNCTLFVPLKFSKNVLTTHISFYYANPDTINAARYGSCGIFNSWKEQLIVVRIDDHQVLSRLSLINFLSSVFKSCPAGIVIIWLNLLYDLLIMVKGCIAAILPDSYNLRQRFRSSYFI